MLKADDTRILQVLQRLSTDQTLMEWLRDQKVSIALSMATSQGDNLAWRQGAVQLITELEKEINGAKKKLQGR